jgi:hypothetical protein
MFPSNNLLIFNTVEYTPYPISLMISKSFIFLIKSLVIKVQKK